MVAAKRKESPAISRRLDRAIAPPAATLPAQHLRTIQEQIEAISRGDLDAVVNDAHESVRLDIYAPLEFDWIRQAVGIGAVREGLKKNFESLDDQHPAITSLTAQGDTVVMIGREHGRIKATGAAYQVQFVHRFLFRDRRLEAITVIVASESPTDGFRQPVRTDDRLAARAAMAHQVATELTANAQRDLMKSRSRSQRAARLKSAARTIRGKK